MPANEYTIGMVGLGVMGQNLELNMAGLLEAIRTQRSPA
jgi:6-phosphogluconate dehydrogenase